MGLDFYKERKTHAFFYVDEYFHRIAHSRSFPMRIFTVSNLVLVVALRVSTCQVLASSTKDAPHSLQVPYLYTALKALPSVNYSGVWLNTKLSTMLAFTIK